MLTLKNSLLVIHRFIFIILLTGVTSSYSQTVFEHISNTGIYEFLDEMANLKVIELNDVIKPYSRTMIASKLDEAVKYNDDNPGRLNKRQLKDLAFYSKAYFLESDTKNLPELPIDIFKKNNNLATSINPAGIFYKDSTFSLAIQPVFGVSASRNSNGNLIHTWGGASLFGYIGKNFGFYTNVRDNNESRLMFNPTYLQNIPSVPVKNFGTEGVDYTEARGGMFYSRRWGAIGIVKDHLSWGLGYNGTNIQSGLTPSFPMIKVQFKPTRWFEFNYYHGFLVSQIVDSTHS